ncbi:histone-lysine N-methyltransferase PRDM9-like [Trichoplusia ni]|uniref:Histone-lysine N-methyltransferase PRDM9-like n=1 Tax=Trichoplusia ni TaxID=7111 RepID=A0A7E5W3M4_TRINI|nr:histone-lysine N-methyltransferase PRDM9-like [Trichoplusia ni]
MDFVKREDQNVIDDDNYKFYVESLQKSHQLEPTDYNHSPISMEQLHQAMQSSVASSIVHNFQLPLSPRQMSSLMLKTNHLPRNLNFNDIPAHLQRNLTMELDLVHNLANELPQNLNRHDDLLTQNLSRNLDLSLVRSLGNDLELQNNLSQLAQNLNENLSADLNRINDLRTDIPHDLSHEIDLSHHLNRATIEQDILAQEEARRTPMVVQMQDQHLLEQRLAPNMGVHERLDQQEHANMLPMPFHIKSEQEDDGYFYDNINPGINVANLNGLPAEHTQPQPNVHTDTQMYAVYNNHVNVPALNSIDLYSRPQNYIQNFTNIRENPQNLVVHRQFENTSPYQEDFKKIRQEVIQNVEKEKVEDPKENLKPQDQNKLYYQEYNQNFAEAKNENDSSAQNKIPEDISMNIKGQYICYKCHDVFPSKRGLKHHSKSCTENENLVERVGKFGCSQCSYRCQSPAILKIHERTHSGEKPFSCTFCDYKSGQKNNVAKHILVHMKEKPFRCQYCDYRCAQKNNLVVHERTHTGYKPFACPFCDYRTVQKPNLVKHMYLHTDQKPFSCDMCSYRCVQKTNLTKHKQRHLNEKDGEKVDVKNQAKPYRPRQKSVKCPHCAYRCVQKSSMEKHLQFKHGTQDSGDIEGLNLMKGGEDVESINLSVKKDFESEKDSVSAES